MQSFNKYIFGDELKEITTYMINKYVEECD